jgi:pyruvate/2-oxoglutarate dehydrogenase complex dihydrolipoamide dehydrogenase (E3) component
MADYDVIVLGGGSAGSSAAKAASLAGARTAMVNDGELGGLCILRGCMPTKTMLASAHAVHEANHLEPLGARLEGRVVPDFTRIMERKDRLVQRFQMAKVAAIEASSYEVLQGRGRFVEGPAIDLEGRRLEAGAYVLATGSAPTLLPIPGIDQVPVITSDEVMTMRERPASLIVQGAGAIGLEFGQFFARIGSEVVLVNRSPLLSRFDPEAGEELRKSLEDEPRLRVLAPAAIDKVRPEGDGLVATIRTSESVHEHRADAILMAVGRHALLDHLGLEQIGITPLNGRIQHDERMRTDNPRVYVAGDVTGDHQVLHTSNQEGLVAGHNAADGAPAATIDYRLKMQAIFTDPPYASVGATREEAIETGRDVIVGRARLPQTGRAITMGVEHGLWRLYACRETGELLGGSMLGPRADDLIHELALLMHFRAKVDEIAALPWYHPTLSEVMLDLVRDVQRQR